MTIQEIIEVSFNSVVTSGADVSTYRWQRVKFWLDVAQMLALAVLFTAYGVDSCGVDKSAGLVFSVIAMVLIYPKYIYDSSPQCLDDTRKSMVAKIVGDVLVENYLSEKDGTGDED